MLKKILNSQTKTITFAAILLGGSALASRVLGLIRDRLLAGRFGAGEELDIYFAAFRIPDFVYGILIMGGIAAVFLPVFSTHFKRSSQEGWQLTSNALNCFLVMLVVVCSILAVFTPSLINLVAPGFSAANKAVTVALTRIMFLSPVLFGLSSIFSGVLHYFNRFLVYSLAPILYNLGIIAGILFFVPLFGIYGLAFGVILGALLHLLIQIPAAKNSGFRYKFLLNFKQPGLKRIFKLMIPRTVGAAAYHLNLIVITAIASTLVAGSIAVFNFANNLQYFPIGVFGVSFALAVFPALSRNWAHGQREEFLQNFSLTFRQILFLIIPTCVLLFLLRAQIVRLVLGTGRFGWADTRLTAACLGVFCLGIWAAALIPFLARVFFSFHNTRTPVAIGIVSMVLNVGFCFLFVELLGFGNGFHSFWSGFLKLGGLEDIRIIGLPLALSLAGIFQFALLSAFLRKKLGNIKVAEILNSLKKIVLGSLLVGVAAYFSLRVIAPFVKMDTFLGVLGQTLFAAIVGGLVYLLVTYFLKSAELKTIKGAIFKQFSRK